MADRLLLSPMFHICWRKALMPYEPRTSLIVPAYNEVNSIAQTIEQITVYFEKRQSAYEIIVSADGNDGTRELVADMAQTDPRIKVIGSTARRGKGYGIRQGVALARGKIIGFVDADNKTPIEEYDKVEPLLRTGYDIVIGSRGLPDALIEQPQPWYRRLGSIGFGIFMHTVVGLRDIPDTQCGFKFFQHYVALDLFKRQRIDGYMFDVEILYLARQAGYRIGQVPVRWRDDGDSRLALVRGNMQNVRDIFSIRFAPVPRAALLPVVEEPGLSQDSPGANL
jgi:dolichyl-phosphate beta-glucosyltransferase